MFDRDASWLPDFIDKLINDDDMDFFKEVMKHEEFPKKKRTSFEEYKIKDTFLGFESFNIFDEIDDIFDHFGGHYKKILK